MLDIVKQLIISTTGIQPNYYNIELIDGNFVSLNLRVKMIANIDDFYLIKDKFLKVRGIELLDPVFTFINNKDFSFNFIIKMRELENDFNKPTVANDVKSCLS